MIKKILSCISVANQPPICSAENQPPISQPPLFAVFVCVPSLRTQKQQEELKNVKEKINRDRFFKIVGASVRRRNKNIAGIKELPFPS